MKRWLWLLSLPISLGIHVVALAAVVWMLPDGALSRVIFIDLNPPAMTPPAPKPSQPPRPRAARLPAAPRAPLLIDERSSAPPRSENPQGVQRPEPAAPMEPPAQTTRAAPPEPPAPAPPAPAPIASTPVPRIEAPGVISTLPHRADGETSGGLSIPSNAQAGSGRGTGTGVTSAGGTDRGGAADGRGRGGVAMSGTGGIGGEGDYGPYRAALRRRIQEALRYPGVARRRGLSGTVELEIFVQPNGAISDVAVVDSSSHRVLDEAAMEAVRSLPPLPFPSGLTPRSLRVRLPVVFELR